MFFGMIPAGFVPRALTATVSYLRGFFGTETSGTSVIDLTDNRAWGAPLDTKAEFIVDSVMTEHLAGDIATCAVINGVFDPGGDPSNLATSQVLWVNGRAVHYAGAMESGLFCGAMSVDFDTRGADVGDFGYVYGATYNLRMTDGGYGAALSASCSSRPKEHSNNIAEMVVVDASAIIRGTHDNLYLFRADAFRADSGTATNIYGLYLDITPTGFTNVYAIYTTSGTVRLGGTLQLESNVSCPSSSGTKIGTSTSQKLGFWNATPVAQQVLSTSATTTQIVQLLQTLGLCRQS